MTAKRTDIHRPSAPEFDPESYTCLGVFDLHPEDGTMAARRQAVAAALARGYSFRGAPHGSAQCSHCGAHLRYAALMVHNPTGTLMSVGETCLDERFTMATREDFAALRTAAARKAEITRERNRRHEIADEVTEYLADMDPRLAELTYRGNGGLVDENTFLSDIAEKLFRYGNLSERQATAVAAAVTRDAERNARFEARARADAERAATAAPAPTGRVEITGTVEHTWVREHAYGIALKMRVRAAEGYVVITTVPAAIVDACSLLDELHGRTVTFTATLTAADDDATVAFAKRPTKARLV